MKVAKSVMSRAVNGLAWQLWACPPGQQGRGHLHHHRVFSSDQSLESGCPSPAYCEWPSVPRQPACMSMSAGILATV